MLKIGNSKVMPRQDTLDLNEILLRYRLKDYSTFYKIKNSIENKLESGEFEDLKKEALKLKKIIQEGKMSLYYERLLKQLLYLVESVIEKTINNNYEKALEKLIEAMRITQVKQKGRFFCPKKIRQKEPSPEFVWGFISG